MKMHLPGAVIESWARCHGADGPGFGLGAYPKLAGQRSDYIFASLQAYARRERHSGIMEPVMAGLSSEGMRELPFYPKLSGQYADYLVLQLELFRDGNRGGTAYQHIMRSVATQLTPEQMRAVALYFALLSSASEPAVSLN